MRRSTNTVSLTLSVLFLSACGPSPADYAKSNFIDSFGQIGGALRTWNCDETPAKGKDADVVRCEYMIHGGYVNKMVKYCSTKKNGGCGYNEKGEK